MSVTIIYVKDWDSFDMSNNMFGTSMLEDGAELKFIIPDKRSE